MRAQSYSWGQIPREIPSVSGIYAWYLRSEVARGEIDQCLSDLASIPDDRPEDKIDRVRALFKTNLIDKLAPSSYEVQLEGKLMPKYRGKIKYVDSLERNVLLRFADNPTRLIALSNFISASSPAFTAPLYIGMSTNLKSRIADHRRAILKKNESKTIPHTGHVDEDQSFAVEVSRRGIDYTNLFVQVLEMDVEGSFVEDLEYILNRISYPIFGKR
jgi:hypothetical protein